MEVNASIWALATDRDLASGIGKNTNVQTQKIVHNA